MANNNELIAQCRAKAEEWLSPSFDEETRSQVKAMLDNPDPTDLIEAFYQSLEFGTGEEGIPWAHRSRCSRRA